MKYEWDETKNIKNQLKHGVSFEEACEVFDDPFALSKLDKRFNYFEERWITIGLSSRYNLLVVANLFFTDEGDEIIRIISARKAKKMKGIAMKKNDRSKYDDFKIQDEYDFSDAVRGRFYKSKKIPTSLRLDDDILLYLKKEASEKKIPYQTLINNLLREHCQSL